MATADPTLADLTANTTIRFGTDSAGNNPYSGLFDDSVVVPYAMPTAEVLALYSMAAAYSSLPRLSVTGNMVGAGTMTAEGEVDSEAVVYHVASGNAHTTGGTTGFRLREV